MTGDEWFHEFKKRLKPVSDRKAQLFAVACCRRVWDVMTDPRHRAVVEAAEQLADGVITKSEFQHVLGPVIKLWGKLPPGTIVEWNPGHYMTGATRHLGDAKAAAHAASYAFRGSARMAGPKGSPGWITVLDEEGEAQQELIQDLVPPVSRITIGDLSWLTSTVLALANGIYADRAFDRMPILADALQDAGCDNEDILNHCRSEGEHVRGCWVIDLLLGKS